jgi:hypothetical protein
VLVNAVAPEAVPAVVVDGTLAPPEAAFEDDVLDAPQAVSPNAPIIAAAAHKARIP